MVEEKYFIRYNIRQGGELLQVRSVSLHVDAKKEEDLKNELQVYVMSTDASYHPGMEIEMTSYSPEIEPLGCNHMFIHKKYS